MPLIIYKMILTNTWNILCMTFASLLYSNIHCALVLPCVDGKKTKNHFCEYWDSVGGFFSHVVCMGVCIVRGTVMDSAHVLIYTFLIR